MIRLLAFDQDANRLFSSIFLALSRRLARAGSSFTITAHFFGRGRLVEMTEVVRELWPQVCHDKRLKPVHIGVADYMLWWYREKTGEPPEKG